ncbi:MAG: formyltransferase [Thermovirgaceae bacterium]|nr:formyltransferase [Thermovirgaceae bacterium]
MSDRPGIVVFAYSEVGYRCLGALLRSGADVRAVFTYEDDPGENTWFSSVRELALDNGLPVFTPDGVKTLEILDQIRNLQPELIFSFYYRDIIPEPILEIPRLGAFNMHGSLLPKYRGRACVNWAIINGETETGPTLHWMTKHPDEGDIVDQERVPIEESDTAMDVMLKIADAAEKVITRNLPLLESGKAPRKEQDRSQATYFGGRRPKDGRIDWNAPARNICNLVRAVTHPYPGAFAVLNGEKIFIWKATPLDENADASPGTVISTDPFLVAAGKGVVRVDEKSVTRDS